MRCLTIALALLVGSSRSLHAQRLIVPIRGSVVDSAGHPIESVAITAASVGRQVRSDSSGRFAIDTLIVGPNRLLARRLGWKAIDTTIVLDAKVPLQVRLIMQRVAQNLGEVRIVSQDACPVKTLEGFDCRRRAGVGAFRDSDEIAALKPACQANILQGMQGLRLVPSVPCPGLESTEGWRCIRYLINGTRLASGAVKMSDYIGVEYYSVEDKVPEWYKNFAYADAVASVATHQAVRGRPMIYRTPALPGRACALVVLWTRLATRYDPSMDQDRNTATAMRTRRDSIMSLADSMLKRKP